MFSTLFGFHGRIGRLRYFLLTIGLALFVVALLVGVILAALPHQSGPANLMASKSYVPLIGGMAIILVPLFLWISLALQAKRLRDIGWNPLYVILGWIAVSVVDRVVVLVQPSLDFHQQHQSAVGLLVNLLMIGCLLFWPGEDFDSRDADGEEAEPPSSGPVARAAVQPAMRVSSGVGRQAGFGRRGL